MRLVPWLRADWRAARGAARGRGGGCRCRTAFAGPVGPAAVAQPRLPARGGRGAPHATRLPYKVWYLLTLAAAAATRRE